jgi:hypothetical protein
LFDIGFSIITSKQLDALYLADGPGIGPFENEVTITSYDIDNDVNDAIITDGYNIEKKYICYWSIWYSECV